MYRQPWQQVSLDEEKEGRRILNRFVAGFAACLGASPSVIENAAEIAIEHNLGLTCDPIDGLVQGGLFCASMLFKQPSSLPSEVPCIERNALGTTSFLPSQCPELTRRFAGAVKAVTAASLAIAGEDAGTGAVTLE